MPQSRAESSQGWIRWLPAAAMLALAPKCVLCVAAYAGIGAFLGMRIGGPEICGASAAPPVGAIAWLAGAAVCFAVARRASPMCLRPVPVAKTG